MFGTLGAPEVFLILIVFATIVALQRLFRERRATTEVSL